MWAMIPNMIEWAMIPWLLLAGGAAYVLYYFLVVGKPPKIYVKQGSNMKALLVNKLPILKETYWPPFWAINPFIQFFDPISPHLYTIPLIKFKTEVVSLPDGGELGLNWADGPFTSVSVPSTIVLILPGLECNIKAKHILSATNMIKEGCGSLCVVLSYRGQGGLKLKTPRITKMNDVEDLSFVIDLIKERYPDAALVAIGFSMGSVLLGHYLVSLGETAKEKLKAAMLISTVLDFTIEELQKDFNWIINRAGAAIMTEVIRRNQDSFRAVISNEKMTEILACKSLHEFALKFTIPQFGFESMDHLSSEMTLAGRLNRIKVPCLILNANDDFYQPGRTLPFAEVLESENCAIILTKHGGHMMFKEGWLPFGYSYCDRVICQVVKAFGTAAEMNLE